MGLPGYPNPKLENQAIFEKAMVGMGCPMVNRPTRRSLQVCNQSHVYTVNDENDSTNNDNNDDSNI